MSANGSSTLLSYPKECDSKRIESVRVYSPKLAAGTQRIRIRLYNVLFLIAYIYQLGWVASTIGEPYRLFLEKADREGFQVMEGATRLRAELEHSFQDINDPNRRTKKIGWTEWMDMDIEELAAEKKRDKEKTVLDSLPKSMRVPHRYAASFWPTLLLGVLAVLHALVLLMQVWSVAFRVWINYKEVDADQVDIPEHLLELDLEEEMERERVNASSSGKDASSGSGSNANKSPNGAINSRIPDRKIVNPPSYLPTHARIEPAKGKHVLVPLEYYPTMGMTFEFHRRRYIYERENMSWSKVRCRTDIPLAILQTWAGFPSLDRLVGGQIRYGPNMFSVKQPTFMELYKAQLLNPFSVFQIFCVLLWAIDDLLIYSLFSLFMVLMFEGTVVFQRLKSLQALRGMGNPSRLIYVHRAKKWIQVDSTELLPGDIMSLTRVKPHHAKATTPAGSSTAANTKNSLKIEDEGGDIVPADLLLLRGSTVVNEASLTGESVPQMKEGLSEFLPEEALAMKDKHKMNVAYAGTKMLQCKGGTDYLTSNANSNENSKVYASIPNPPDDGCVCFVLRTGFASAQGKLVRMIEGSQEKVKGHERETGLLLLLLCFFAILSSSYVLYHGVQNENRSKYELLLHCILIVTSVIRPELPMQMAMAVNNSLMTLMKMHVFCTEPYRVPMAGKLDACLFDKTGTLTTDELVAVGVCEATQLTKQNSNNNKSQDASSSSNKILTPMLSVSGEAALVLAGCHSLLVFDGETTGDPLESAALSSMKWHLDLTTGHAIPMPAKETTNSNATATATTNSKKPLTTAGGNPLVIQGDKITQVQILQRYHFSSKLQRMSCVIQTHGGNNANGKRYAVVKGSPEAIGRHLANKPTGYDAMAAKLSKEGYRMIALAYKPLVAGTDDFKQAMDSRAACEADLTFCGFIAFTCMVRKDTASVLQRLREGGMTTAMVTGDALLTAIHVAKQVHICEPINDDAASLANDKKASTTNPELQALLDKKRNKDGSKNTSASTSTTKSEPMFKKIAFLDTMDDDKSNRLVWRSYDDDKGSVVADYVASDLPVLSQEYDLATTGKSLALAFEQDEMTSQFLQHIKVFARMTPDAKEQVIECLHSIGALCLMCGDGANDVGALKQADVGVALLTGFGNLNVDKTGGSADKADSPASSTKEEPPVTAIMSKEHLDSIRAMPVRLIKAKIQTLGTNPNDYPELVEKEDLVQLYQIKARELAVKRHDKKNQLDQTRMTKAQQEAEKKAKLQEKQRRLQIRIAELEAQGVQWASFKAMREFINEEAEETKRRKGELTRGRGVEGSAATLAAQFEDMESPGDLPMVKLGDASIAAPFTSKMPSIKSCVDIVRQGRCTLVSSTQMYQIMALQCLISSYSLSVLYLDGVKYGDTQMTAMGLLGSVSFMSVSRSKPLDKLSKVRPLSSIFHPALIFSLLGQFAIHLTTMLVAVHMAKKHLPPDYEVDLDGQFKPGMLNTVVFLVTSVQQVTVFAVNLQGAPFMTGVSQNRPLLYSLTATFVLTFMFASESIPGLNRYFQLVSFPDEKSRDFILIILAMDLVATFLFDRIMQFCFCRDILMASIQGTTFNDIFGMVRTFGVIALLMYSFMGNSEQWDELLAMEMEMAGNATDELGGNEAEGMAECVGAACAVVNETVKETVQAMVSDEF